MIYKFYLLVMLSLVSLVVYSQSDYTEYHKKINQAEALLVNERFEEAVSLYSSIFSEYEYVFVKDLVIASQITTLNNQPEKTNLWLERAITNGYECACIEKIKVFENYIKTDDWHNILKKQDELKLNYRKSIDLNLHYEFHKRYKTEQESKGTEKYAPTVLNNYSRIKTLMDSIPFPSERIIGIDNESIYPTKKGGKLKCCEASNSKVIPTLLHYDNPITDIGWIKFQTAIRSGHLHPRQFAYIYSFETNYVSRINKDRKKNPPILPEYIFNYAFGKKTDDLKKANADRHLFGIGSIEIDKAKHLLELKYGLRLKFGNK